MEGFKNKYFDYSLVFFIFLLMTTSCIGISSAQSHGQYGEDFLTKQIVWFVVGTIVVFIIFLFDFEQIQIMSPYLYALGILLLLILLVSPDSIAPMRNGAKSWFIFPKIGSFQPSEYMKIFLILMLSYITKKHSDEYTIGDIRDDLKYLSKVLVVASIPMGLVLLQSDFGTTLVLFVITTSIIFISGIHKRIIFVFITSVASMITVLIFLFIYKQEWPSYLVSDYQLNRIYAWLNPVEYKTSISYQLYHSLLAVGSGKTFGNGFSNGAVYIPEAHSDFIFTVISEDFGFIGSSTVVILYFLILYRITQITHRQKNKTFEKLICTGMIGMIFFHAFQNIGMVIGLLPITGIPLLLVSYGGSSVLASMLGIGLVLNISLKEKDYLFGGE